MLDTVITFFQIFGIGFSFGIAGPCFVICAPVLITYIAGRKKTWRQALGDTFVFLSGRLTAYLILGYLAGLSGKAIRDFTASGIISLLQPLGGGIIIILGIFVLTGKNRDSRLCRFINTKASNFSSLFLLGFVIGILPCAPLLALLLEISLISKTALEGMIYSLFFGLGTLISGLIVIGGLTGIFSWLPKTLKSERTALVFRVICGLLLIALGIRSFLRA